MKKFNRIFEEEKGEKKRNIFYEATIARILDKLDEIVSWINEFEDKKEEKNDT